MNAQEIKSRIPSLSTPDTVVIARVIGRHDAFRKLTGCNDAIAAELCNAAATESLADMLASHMALTDLIAPSLESKQE